MMVKGLTKWEILPGFDVRGADLESIADKKLAFLECYTNSACQGIVWSDTQGKAYLKKDTSQRTAETQGLQLSLYVRAYEEFRGSPAGRPSSSASVKTPDEAKAACEAMPGCQGFVTRPGSTTADFYTSLGEVMPSGDQASIVYRRARPSDIPAGTSPAAVMGGSSRPPVDISEDPPIIVGGTDGSGTRAVVTMLSNLEVLMVKDDVCTFDVHAGEMGGWPPVVRRAIRHSGGANYRPEDIPEQDRAYLRRSLRRFADKMKGEAKRHSKLKYHKRWGFKAPISQMLLPFLEEVFPGFSFVQVLRDGRDLPFSKNQSPVDKFYHQMYMKAPAEVQNLAPKLKAIRMWSDANTQVQTYMKTVAVPKGSAYIKVKIEMSVEEESLYQMGQALVKALGLEFKREDMCCRLKGYIDALKEAKVLEGVRKRYGKWRQKTENKLKLREDLNQQGHEGLAEFKYLEDPSPALYEVSSSKVCEGVTPTECEFDIPRKCIESPDIR